jgi:hypothetical protein
MRTHEIAGNWLASMSFFGRTLLVGRWRMRILLPWGWLLLLPVAGLLFRFLRLLVASCLHRRNGLGYWT